MPAINKAARRGTSWHLRPELARSGSGARTLEPGYDRPLDLIGEYRRVVGALLAMAEGLAA